MKDSQKSKQQLMNELATLRKRVAELENSETRCKFVEGFIEELKDEYFFYVHDAKGVFTYAGPSITDVLGYTREEFFTHFTEHLTDNPINKGVVHFTEQALQGERQPPYEVEVFHKNGEIRTLEVTEVPLLDDHGNVIAVQGIAHDITSRKKAEEEHFKNEQRTRAVFDQTFQFMGLMTLDGTLIEANRTSLKFSGIDEADVLGKPFWETPWWSHSPALRRRLREAVAQAAKGKLVRFEATHPASDGSLAYIDFSLKPLKDESGEVVLLIPEGRDITVLKRVEKALRESEDTALALLNAPSDSAILIDTDGGIKALNKVAANQFGKTQKDLLGKNLFDILLPHVVKSRRMRILHVVETTESVRYEDERDGRFFDNNIYPIVNENGLVTQVAIYARDITDYKRALARIRERTADLIESEEKYRTLVENVPLVVYRMNSTGEILLVNSFVEEVFGYAVTEIFRDPEIWRNKVFEEDRTRVRKYREDMFQKGKEVIAEYRVKHKNGSIVYVMDHSIPFQGGDGRITSVDGIIMDVTGRIELQKKLVRAKELKTISEISSRLAHEIRNPLVSAGGFARRLLASMNPDDPNRAKMEIIVREVARLEDILRMILNYIQPLELYLSPTDPNYLVETAINTVSDRIKEREVHLNLDLAPNLPNIPVDQPQFEQVLETLIKNALNQMKNGTVLSVSTFLENGSFRLIMKYPVVHISPDDVEHFFFPFTTSQSAYDTRFLPMSKIIVDKHGGSINVHLDNNNLIIQIALPC